MLRQHFSKLENDHDSSVQRKAKRRMHPYSGCVFFFYPVAGSFPARKEE
jgi:hypothetical protein